MYGLFTVSRRAAGALAIVTFALAPARLAAQSAAEHVAMGDKDHQALNAPGAPTTRGAWGTTMVPTTGAVLAPRTVTPAA